MPTSPRPAAPRARAAADDRAEYLRRHRAGLVLLRLGRLRRAVPQGDVADLVRQRACELAFGLRRLDQPAIDIGKAARKREGVDIAHVNALVGVAELRVLKLA